MDGSEIQIKAQVFVLSNKLYQFIKILVFIMLTLLEYRHTKKRIIQ